jgi:class 3 adenylate cyclase
VATNNFIGRTRETAFLADAVQDALSGRGRLVMLLGEAGIGKTRLAEEAATRAAASGARVLWGRCWEDGGAPAFWPWIQVIRGSLAAGSVSDSMLAEARPGLALIAQLVPELRDSLPRPESVPEAHAAAPLADTARRPGSERFRLFDTITNLFKGLAARKPLMMVLDDLHAADEDSLMLLRFLARELKQARILVVATFRELEVKQSAPHASLLAEIGREGSALPLRGLSVDEVGEFIRSVAAIPASADLVSTLQHATGGNPFFLDEIARLMIAERALGRTGPVGPDFAIPDSIRATIDRRLGKLAEGTRILLSTAAMIGNEFEVALLQSVSGVPHGELLERLGEAAAAAVIVEPTRITGAYRFSNAIVAEVLRTALGMAVRAQLHQRIAAAMERLHHDDQGPYLAQLAHHYCEALPVGSAEKAIEYSRRGAERARSQLAFAEAVRLYGMALRALGGSPQPDQEQTCGMLLAMGEAQAQGGSLDDARHAFERAADIARGLGRADLIAQTALHASAWFGTFFTHDHALTTLVEEALAAAGDGDSAVRASLLAILGGERYWAMDRESGLALSDEAVSMARRIGDPRALVSALWVASQIRWGPDDVEGRLASATEIATLAESIGDHQRALRAHEMRFTALLEMGDMHGVRAETHAYDALARRAGEEFGIVERFEAAQALLRGDFDSAERQIQALSGHAERRQDPALLVCVFALSAALWEEQGRLEPAQVSAATSALLAESPALRAQYRVVSALLQLASGQRDEAAAELEALAGDHCAAIPRDWNWLDNMRGLSILCGVLRDARHAAIVYELLRPYAQRNITQGWGDVARGSAALYLGSLARLLGRLDDAQMHLDLALEFNQRMGARPSVARTQCEAGRLALQRNTPDDHSRALPLLRASLATASALGMKPLEQRVRAYLRRAGEADDVSPATDDVSPATAAESKTIEALAASAIGEPNTLHAHAAPDGTLTILFTDVEGSTVLFDTLGDLRAQEILDAHNAIVRQQVAQSRGVEVKSTGDGFMMVFSSARRALLCAIGIQRALAAYSQQHGNVPIRVRMGLHVGEPLKVTSDLAGKAVIIAARIASVAQGGEILVSSTLRELTEAAGDLRFGERGDVELKGLSGTYRLYRVIW